MSGRVRRVVPSTVNTPVAVRVTGAVSVENDELQLLLEQFLQESAKLDQSDASANISQLKRLQRELRGLPPLVQESVAPQLQLQQLGFALEESLPKGTKVKFDDYEPQDLQEEVLVPKIDKEERKRLKKERRKEERKKKSELAE